MRVFKKSFAASRLSPAASKQQRPVRRRLGMESLEAREVLSTVPFVLVNNTTANNQGTLAFGDDQIYVTFYGQDYSAGKSSPFYYFDSAGGAHLTTSITPNAQGQQIVPSFKLSDMTNTGSHTYTINLPENLPLPASANGIQSARVYFSMNAGLNLSVNGDAEGSVNGPTPGNSFFDFFEFSLNAPANPVGNLNIDTTNVDQFGFPIEIKVASTDPNNLPDGVGTDTTRASVISQFQAFTSTAGDPYAICLWPTSDPTYGPYRILNPSGVLNQVQPAINIVQVQTTLQLAVTPTATTINVYCAAAFPNPSSDFTIKIDNELMTVTAATQLANGTTNWTVLRGQQGTQAVGHVSSTFVTVPDPAMSATQTTLTVAGDTNFPASGSFAILVDSEIMQVTGVKSQNLDGTTTWNVLRGQGGTTAVAHNERARVFYSAVTSLALNSYFNAAIDALFTKYKNPASDPQASVLTLQSIASGATLSYTGTVVQDSAGNYVLRFNTTGDNTNYDIYYPFFNDNSYYWNGYTPQLTTAAAPGWAAGADVASMSPSDMVFSCNGVFADNTFRPNMDATQQKVIADLENQVVSALNRGVALLPGYSSTGVDSWQDASYYYNNVKNTTGQVWNRYAEFLHKDTVSIDGKNYGFAFDDQQGHASDIAVANFTSATITLGPWAGGVPAATGISLRNFLASSGANTAFAPPVQASIPATPQGNVNDAGLARRLSAVDAAHLSLAAAAAQESSLGTIKKTTSQQAAATATLDAPIVAALPPISIRSILSSRGRR